jgi:tripartite-type tricarboxylate transporter receptor subunit TctC
MNACSPPPSHPRRRDILRAGIGLAALPLLPQPARAEDWPIRPVKLVVPFAPGGTTDMLGRLMAARLSQDYGQPFEVENKPGAGGNIAADFVAKAAPDGYTLLVGTPGLHAINRFVYKSIGYDASEDLTPVILFARVPNLLAVTNALPVYSVTELIAYAKARPGELFYGSPGLGSTAHVATELFKSATGIRITKVPYKGSAPMLADLIEGRVHLAIDNLPAAQPHVRAGAIRALAVSSSARWPLLPDLPTIAESGIPGYEAASWFTIAAPAHTTPEIIAGLNSRIHAFVTSRDGAAKLRALGAEPVGGSPEDTRRHVLAEIDKWGRVAEAAGITPE